MTKLKLILQWSVMLLFIAFALAGVAWTLIWAGEAILTYEKQLKRLFSFTAFWLLVFGLVRLAWHLGSKYKAQARRAEQLRRVS